MSGAEKTGLPGRGRLKVGGLSIEYLRIAAVRPELPVLVLLHEGLGCVDMWRDFPERLAAHTGAEVFVYSRPGYGRSSAVELPRPATYMHVEAHDVLPAVLAAAAIRECVLVGHSDGGSIALLHAGGVEGHLARGLVLLAAHVFNETVTVNSIRAARDAYESTDLRTRLARYHGDNVDTAFRGWNDVWLSDGFREWNIESYLPRITQPVVVVQGEEDGYGTTAQVHAIANGVRGPVVTELWADCGHSPQRDQPERLLSTITRHLQTVSAG